MIESARILVVDDEKVIRDGCERILTKAGHQVVTAADGQSALEAVRAERFDIVLLDIKMPVLDGMEVLEVLRREQPEILVVVITGYAVVETAVEAMKAGAYDLVVKPFAPDALRIVVRRALDHLNLTREAEALREEQARSLRDIAAEQSRIRTIINSMANGILVTDNEKNVVLYNPVATHLLDIKVSPITGRPIQEVVPQPKLVEMIDQLFEHRDVCYTSLAQEIEVGENVFLRATSAPVRDAEGNILGAVTVLQDISYLKELDRMKSDFVTMVSHELKAPLAAIQQQLEVLLEGMTGELNERQAHFLQRARIRAQGLIDLINKLLDLSRIEAGPTVSQQEPTDLAPILNQVLEVLRPQAQAKGQEIVLEVPSSLPHVSADPENMDEVFMNLLSNAIKFTPEKGRLQIQARVAGDYLQVRVQDNGYGIPKGDLSKIFDRFYRVKSDKTRTISGTGLGLPIVKGIVEAHRGTISVESELGRGTTFTVELPLLGEEVLAGSSAGV